ncbi:MBL fold metallo-hydrolase [Georgenia sp. Z1344]|uniref:MBL fold metallo-hydrolase n=1 Tax=Georgenia sp. Z1344 TaxID=3416706 RepID=UPI003CEF17DC
MLLRRVVAPALDVNTYVLAPSPSGPCVVVDPGGGSAGPLAAVLADLDLTVGAVLVTHGHPDHVWDAAAVADPAGVAVQIASPDRPRLADPAGPDQVGELLGHRFPQIAGTPWREPARSDSFSSALLTGGGTAVLPGLGVRGIPAPGHTAGSTVLLLQADTLDTGTAGDPGHLDLPASTGPHLLLLTGDVVFAGSVGRTDLPGGDPQAMDETLRTLTKVVDPRTILLPGHGPVTTLERELATNPFLV